MTDVYSNPVAGTAVTFAIGSGGGVITPTNPIMTSRSGRATVVWTVGSTTGFRSNSLTATAAGFLINGNPITWLVTTVPVTTVPRVSPRSS